MRTATSPKVATSAGAGSKAKGEGEVIDAEVVDDDKNKS
jgi:hypothetical protein